jgi:hypothetical protein
VSDPASGRRERSDKLSQTAPNITDVRSHRDLFGRSSLGTSVAEAASVFSPIPDKAHRKAAQ